MREEAVMDAEALAFHRGIISALYVVDAHDEDTVFREIVEQTGAAELWCAAEQEDRDAFLRRRLLAMGKRPWRSRRARNFTEASR
jgi:hypothetical protein